MNCPQCGHKNPPGESSCLECGNELEESFQELDEGSKSPDEAKGTRGRGESRSDEIDLRIDSMPRSPIADLFLGREGTTDASLITSLLIGLLLTGVWYFVFPVPMFTPSYFSEIFSKRGGIPYFIVWFTFSCLATLFMKGVKALAQRKVFRLTLVPSNLRAITVKNAMYLAKNISQKVPRPKTKVLSNRIMLALHQFKSTGNIEQASNILSYQADIDMGTLESSYTMINTFIWAVPILGFLGTVIGIGSAIGGFSGIIEEAVEIEAIKGALKVVTSGLATAFDTTLLGLISAMILMFISTPLRKTEEEFLTAVETFSIENLLNRMKGGKIATADDEEEGEIITDRDTALKFKRIVEDAVDNCIKNLEGSFVSWKDGFSEVLSKMTSQTQELSEGFSSINPVVGTFQEIMGSFTTNMTKISGEQNTMMDTFSQEIRNVQPMVENLKTLASGLSEERKMFLDQVDNWISNFNQSGQDILGKIENHNQQQYQSIQSIVQNLEQQRLTFDDGIGKWIQDFDNVGKNMFQATESTLQKIEGISELFSGISSKYEETIQHLRNTSDQLMSSNETFIQAKDEISKLTDNQEQLMLMFNKSFEQQVTSDTLFRDTLVGIKNGLEAMYSPLEVLSRPKKIHLVEE